MKIKSLFICASIAALAFGPAMRAQAATASQPAYNNSAAVSRPNQVVYSPHLPSAADLTSAASAQGMTVERITESGSQVIAVYRLANGQMTTVSYQLLPTAGASASTNPAPNGIVTPTTPAPAVDGMYAPAQGSSTVVYAAPSPDSYYYYPDAYGWGWYPPYYGVGLGLGFYRGFGYYHGFGGFHGGFRGGFHGGFHGSGFHR